MTGTQLPNFEIKIKMESLLKAIKDSDAIKNEDFRNTRKWRFKSIQEYVMAIQHNVEQMRRTLLAIQKR
ncbi:hypothetical protein QQG55_28460 [Brugia pahangi]